MVKMVQYSAVIILTYFPDYFRLYLRTCCPVVLFNNYYKQASVEVDEKLVRKIYDGQHGQHFKVSGD